MKQDLKLIICDLTSNHVYRKLMNMKVIIKIIFEMMKLKGLINSANLLVCSKCYIYQAAGP